VFAGLSREQIIASAKSVQLKPNAAQILSHSSLPLSIISSNWSKDWIAATLDPLSPTIYSNGRAFCIATAYILVLDFVFDGNGVSTGEFLMPVQSAFDKADHIRRLQQEKDVVYMGDGVNDLSALFQAQVGILFAPETSSAVRIASHFGVKCINIDNTTTTLALLHEQTLDAKNKAYPILFQTASWKHLDFLLYSKETSCHELCSSSTSKFKAHSKHTPSCTMDKVSIHYKLCYLFKPDFYVYLMWTRYYKHCQELAKLLSISGHRSGDPTYKPMGGIRFFIDIWANYDTVAFAVLHASKNEDIPVMLAAFLYISRAFKIGLPRVQVSPMTTAPKVAVLSRGLAQKKQTTFHYVSWAPFPLLVSLGMLFNLPLKAYITENMPWTKMPMSPTYANFSDFNSSTLALFQQNYNRQTLPLHATYFEDRIHNGYVMRYTFNMRGLSLMPVDICLHSFMLGMPGVVFYGKSFDDLICEFTAANHTDNATMLWHNRGTCMDQYFVGNDLAYQCIWLTVGNEIKPENFDPMDFTLTYAVLPYPIPVWYWIKFAFRVANTGFVTYLLWTNYYKHCYQLANTLATLGHRTDLKDCIYTYRIIMGDPTAMILTNPWVALAFFFDIWSSYEIVTFAVLRASQGQDIPVMFVAFLYLSRTVWLPYLALCLTAVVLKRWKGEHLFDEVDPTLVVIASAIYGPGLSYCMGNVAFLLDMYHFTERCLIPSSLQLERFEAFPATFLYSITLGSLPLVYGFAIARSRISCTTSSSTAYSSLQFNPIKTRIVLALQQRFSDESVCKELGGTIYSLFAAFPRYQSCPTISFRGADCYVLCYCDGKLQSRIRLSLLSALDLNLKDPIFAIQDSKSNTPYAFNVLQGAAHPERLAAKDEHTLKVHGHTTKDSTDHNWTYQVLWGDPTAIVLMDPYIATAFAIDCWLSVDIVSIVIMRATHYRYKNHVIGLLLFFLVWFGYAALCVTSKYLKRKHKEHTFKEVDPTLVAIAATVYGPTVAWTEDNVAFMLAIFHFLFQITYYCHCIKLEHLIRTEGHRYDLKSDQRERRYYELVWGDPTPIILMNPYVATSFFLDVWFSAETMSIVVPRSGQNDDIYTMLSAFLYLSRTVWFAYAAMSLVASLLKHYHKEHAIIEIDPTV
ncbi:hypothetical protein THRCLA_07016, partial [Thraustotheca clavata]